ncbi:type II toxin-antitoxin system RelE/ParE family toxin [Pendulispora albinea]|uniref:Type II toxin-antitoxin system RelE/ParE family toxin n=1 Tax=Pendulispora albinea TaxID=2741071 RepID=A0ABZ2LV58_9BACT
MRLKLTADARRDLRAYVFHVASENPRAAKREQARILAELSILIDAPVEGPSVRVENWPRPARRWFVHPFRVYYERSKDAVVVLRLYHHAREPIERD